MAKNKFIPLVRLVAACGIILLASCFIMGYIWKAASLCDFFKIKEVVIRQGNPEKFAYLEGKNIFNIDLKEESRRILAAYPDCSRVRIVRILPNRIFIDLIKRKPLAFVKLYKYFVIDEEGVLFSTQSRPEDLELPVILGLETKLFGPRSGSKYNIKEFLLALDIIKEVSKNQVLRNYRIKKIDVAKSSSASISISLSFKQDTSAGQPQLTPEGLEVKLGEANIKDKMAMLADILIDTKKDSSGIKYIDLRFKEPVIKLKDVK